MITRVARNDVVRLTRTGEVGLVKGWADHEKLAQNGTIVDVEVGRGQTIQANGNALEFVANAKFKAHPAKAWLVVLVAALAASYVGYRLSQEASVTLSVLVGLILYPGWDRLLTSMFLRPKKVRLTLPKVPAQGRPRVSK